MTRQEFTNEISYSDSSLAACVASVEGVSLDNAMLYVKSMSTLEKLLSVARYILDDE